MFFLIKFIKIFQNNKPSKAAPPIAIFLVRFIANEVVGIFSIILIFFTIEFLLFFKNYNFIKKLN